MGHGLVTVDEREQGARRKRAEDDLEPDVLSERDEANEKNEGASHADLRRRVLEAHEHSRQAPGALYTCYRQSNQHHDQREYAKQDQLACGIGRALAGEEQRQQDDRAEVGDRCRSDHELPEVGADVVGVLEHRDDDPERRRDEDDRNEQRRLDEASTLQRQADDDPDHERRHKAHRRQLQRPSAKSLDVDLQAGKE